MGATRSSGMSVDFERTTRLYISEERILRDKLSIKQIALLSCQTVFLCLLPAVLRVRSETLWLLLAVFTINDSKSLCFLVMLRMYLSSRTSSMFPVCYIIKTVPLSCILLLLGDSQVLGEGS
jgi:hypothetical protein